MWPFSSSAPTFDPTTDLVDLTGKVILVSGANKGIGLATVKHLARAGARVYLGSRSESRATEALAKLQEEEYAPGEVIWLPLDMSDPRLAKKGAEDFLSREGRLDVLVNNAGMLFGEYDTSQDGISAVVMTNHISTFVLTMTLLPLLKQTAKEPDSDVRIVTLASKLHMFSRGADPNIRFRSIDDFNGEYPDDKSPHVARYSISKLANILFTNALQRRLTAQAIPITCISLHPGLVNTFADRMPYPQISAIFFRWFFYGTDEGSYTSCFAAASPLVKQDPEKYRGKYLEPFGVITEVGENAKKVELGEDLWETTERFLKGIGL